MNNYLPIIIFVIIIAMLAFIFAKMLISTNSEYMKMKNSSIMGIEQKLVEMNALQLNSLIEQARIVYLQFRELYFNTKAKITPEIFYEGESSGIFMDTHYRLLISSISLLQGEEYENTLFELQGLFHKYIQLCIKFRALNDE